MLRSSTSTAVPSSSLYWPLPKRFQEGTPRCSISCAAQQRYPSTLLKRLAVPGQADAAPTYAIARGSAMECAAMLDALFVLKAVDATTKQRGDDLLERIVGMLTRLCR